MILEKNIEISINELFPILNTPSLMDYDDAFAIFAYMEAIPVEKALTKLIEKATYSSRDEVFSNLIMSTKHIDNIVLNIYGGDPNGKDPRFKVNVRKKDGARTTVAGNTKEELEKNVKAFLKKERKINSIDSIYENFASFRDEQVARSTIIRDRSDYQRFLKGTKFAKKDISLITVKEISDFLKDTVIREKLNNKRYKALRSLIFQIFDYAVLEKIIDFNIARCVKHIGKKFFDRNGAFNEVDISQEYSDEFKDSAVDAIEHLNESENKQQYFTASEENKLIAKCIELFHSTHNTGYLGIALTFFLGLRIGELSALRIEHFDLVNNSVSIRLCEKSKYKSNHRDGCYVSDRLKTDHSVRTLPLSNNCKTILAEIIAENTKRGLDSCHGYLFINSSGVRMTTNSIGTCLRIACRESKLKHRSLHKIRKTLLSRLDMSMAFSLERIREYAGHSRGSITLYTNYFFTIPDISSEIKKCTSFEDVVDFGVVNVEKLFAI